MANKTQEAIYKRRREVWKEIIFDLTSGMSRDEIAKQRLQKLDEWRRNPWAYFTGRDVPNEEFPEGRPIIWTPDERDENVPVKPFPADFEYLYLLTKELWGPQKVTLIAKARQLYVSTHCLLNIDWYSTFRAEREIVVSKVKEEAAIKLINDKIRVVHQRKPNWLQVACPQSADPKNIITYGETNSTVTAVAQNFATGDARGITGSLIMVDEAAFQPMFPEIYRAILPMAARLWAVSTANIGNPGAALFKQLIFEGLPQLVEEEEEIHVEKV